MDKVKQMLEKVKKAVKILSKIPPPVYIGIAIGIAIFALLIIIVCLFYNFGKMGVTANAAETEGTGWWWPIGSAETTKEGGKLFASGEPVNSTITSGVGPRWGRSHNGIDIASPGSPPGPYIIASRDGTVEYVIDGFSNNGYYGSSDGGGYGNHVIIDYGDGMKVIYGHLSTNSIKVNVGDKVTYGQVIGNMGNSGSSTGMHLHFEMRLNGEVVDPEEYVDSNEPRPVTISEYTTIDGTSALAEYLASWENDALRQYKNGKITDYNSSEYIYMCITKDKKNYIMHDDINTGYGNRNYGFGICFYKGSSNSFQNIQYFKDQGIDVTQSKYNKYGESKISVDIVDRIKEEIIKDRRADAKKIASNKGLTLTDYQIDAIAACLYQGYESTGAFLEAYKKYGLNEKIRQECSGMNRNCEPPDRGDANWKLFSTGKYIDKSGKEIVINSSTGNATVSEKSGTGYSKNVSIGSKIYKVYNQGYYGGNIAMAGCSISSEAIVCSGYKVNQTPETLAQKWSHAYPRGIAQIANDLTTLGITSTARTTYNSTNNTTIKNQAIKEISQNLSKGRPVVILVRAGSNAKYTRSAHYIVLVGYGRNGKPIIADPNGGKTWNEDSVEDLVNKYIYYQSSSEQGYVLIKK